MGSCSVTEGVWIFVSVVSGTSSCSCASIITDSFLSTSYMVKRVDWAWISLATKEIFDTLTTMLSFKIRVADSGVLGLIGEGIRIFGDLCLCEMLLADTIAVTVMLTKAQIYNFSSYS